MLHINNVIYMYVFHRRRQTAICRGNTDAWLLVSDARTFCIGVGGICSAVMFISSYLNTVALNHLREIVVSALPSSSQTWSLALETLFWNEQKTESPGLGPQRLVLQAHFQRQKLTILHTTGECSMKTEEHDDSRDFQHFVDSAAIELD